MTTKNIKCEEVGSACNFYDRGQDLCCSDCYHVETKKEEEKPLVQTRELFFMNHSREIHSDY